MLDIHLYDKHSDLIMLKAHVHLYSSATSFQRLSHARNTPAQQAFRLSPALDVHLYNKLSEIGSR